jgi:hypothetical protein
MRRRQNNVSVSFLCFTLLFVIWCVAAWITHVINCIQNNEWLFLIAGAIAVPVAWVHGTGIWFGFW